MTTLSVDEAMARLVVIPDYDCGNGPEPCVHTFRGGAVLIGAHWSVEDARAAMERHGVEEAGPIMRSLSHGIGLIDDTGPVFFETGGA